VFNPIDPHLYHRLSIRRKGGATTKERVAGGRTYPHQLRAFTAAVQHGTPFPTGTDDAIANMAVIDAVYRAAGMEPRG
jgi:predicted dehydrogenase